MKFDTFCSTVFSLLEQESVPVTETTSLKDEIDVDSLQMVNLVTCIADYYHVPFNLFIEKANQIGTFGGLYTIVQEGISDESI